MKRYNPVLAEKVRSKLTGDCVTALVTEAFVNALPFKPEDVARESTDLAGYAIRVVNSMHPENLIDRALESATSENAQDYLKALESEISAVVESSTASILKSCDNSPVPEVIKQAKLDEKDVEKFASAGQRAGVGAISKLVKEKMLDVIKGERDAYETAEKLRQEVKNAIQEEKDDVRDSLDADDDDKFTKAPVNKDPTPEAEESAVDDQADAAVEEDAEQRTDSVLESYFNVVLQPSDPRNHVSVFSKLQDICMESLLRSGETPKGEIPYGTIEKVTLESTFPFFDLSARSLQDDLRALQLGLEATTAEDSDEEAKQKKIQATAKTAFISTVCIMTLLEVLKTMHLAKPTVAQVKDFVDTQTASANTVGADLERIENKVDSAADSVKRSVAMGALSAIETMEAKENLTSIRDTLQNMNLPAAASESQSRILGKLTAAIESSFTPSDRIIRTDSRAVRMKEENVTNLGHAVHLLSRKPAVESIQLYVDTRTQMVDDNGTINILAKAFEANGAEVASYGFDFHPANFLGDTIGEAVMECAQYCEFKKAPKPVSLVYANEGYSVPLKFE